jgi:CRP-like cAMP-binding protein
VNHHLFGPLRTDTAPRIPPFIREIRLFDDIGDDVFDRLKTAIDDVHLITHEMLYQGDDPATAMFILRRGLIRLTLYLPEGTQRVVRVASPGSIIGLESLVSERYEHHAQALGNAALFRIPASTIERLDHECPGLNKRMMAYWHQTMIETDHWLTRMSTGSARARVARLCLYLGRNSHPAILPCETGDVPDAICILPGREDIGAMLGVTTETASRIIADFRRQGLLVHQGHNCYVLDTHALALTASPDANAA